MAFENERKFLLKNDNWKKGVSNKDICNIFKRTSTGIASRLVRLGKICERDEFRNRK